MTRLTNQVVVVTGASGGIGRALARALSAQGAQVLNLDVRQEDHPSGARFMPTDLQSSGQISEVIAAILAEYGRIDALVNNAAVTDLDHHELVELPVDVWDQIFQVNVRGGMLVTRAVLPSMRARQRGNVVFVTSSLGLFKGGVVGDVAYSASKAAVESMAYTLSLEESKWGININTVYPSVKVQSGFFRHVPTQEWTSLAPPTLLNDAIVSLLALPPASLTGRSLDQQQYDHDSRYRAQFDAPHATAVKDDPT